MDIQDLLEKTDRKLFKLRSADPDCPLSNKEEERNKDHLRNRTAHRPEIKSDGFKNVF